MADHTHIEWTDATWNPVTGCSVVSPGCTNCYAMKLAGTRLKHHPSRAGLTVDTKAGPVWNGMVRLNEQWLDQPLRWKRPRMIFVCAHGDLFHEDVPDEWIDRVFAVMAEAHWHTFQILTKRSARARAYLSAWATRERIGDIQQHEHGDNCAYTNLACDAIWPLNNVWLGVSAEDQQRADERVPDLLETPAAVRFVSAEPLLGPIEFADVHDSIDSLKRRSGARLDWIIVGGESGPGARPMHPDWVRNIRDACAAAGTAFFFKQWGTWSAFYDRYRDDPDWRLVPKVDGQMGSGATQFLNLAGGCGFHGEKLVAVRNVGKKRAGRLLDGVEHNGMPKA